MKYFRGYFAGIALFLAGISNALYEQNNNGMVLRLPDATGSRLLRALSESVENLDHPLAVQRQVFYTPSSSWCSQRRNCRCRNCKTRDGMDHTNGNEVDRLKVRVKVPLIMHRTGPYQPINTQYIGSDYSGHPYASYPFNVALKPVQPQYIPAHPDAYAFDANGNPILPSNVNPQPFPLETWNQYAPEKPKETLMPALPVPNSNDGDIYYGPYDNVAEQEKINPKVNPADYGPTWSNSNVGQAQPNQQYTPNIYKNQPENDLQQPTAEQPKAPTTGFSAPQKPYFNSYGVQVAHPFTPQAPNTQTQQRPVVPPIGANHEVVKTQPIWVPNSNQNSYENNLKPNDATTVSTAEQPTTPPTLKKEQKVNVPKQDHFENKPDLKIPEEHFDSFDYPDAHEDINSETAEVKHDPPYLQPPKTQDEQKYDAEKTQPINQMANSNMPNRNNQANGFAEQPTTPPFGKREPPNQSVFINAPNSEGFQKPQTRFEQRPGVFRPIWGKHDARNTQPQAPVQMPNSNIPNQNTNEKQFKPNINENKLQNVPQQNSQPIPHFGNNNNIRSTKPSVYSAEPLTTPATIKKEQPLTVSKPNAFENKPQLPNPEDEIYIDYSGSQENMNAGETEVEHGTQPPYLQNPEDEYFDSNGELEAQEITYEHTPKAGLEKYAPVNQRSKAEIEQKPNLQRPVWGNYDAEKPQATVPNLMFNSNIPTQNNRRVDEIRSKPIAADENVPQGQPWNNNNNNAPNKLTKNLAKHPTAPTRGRKEQPLTIPNQNVFGNKPPLLQNPEEEYFDSYGEMEAQEITNEHTRTPKAGLEKYPPVNQRSKAETEQKPNLQRPVWGNYDAEKPQGAVPNLMFNSNIPTQNNRRFDEIRSKPIAADENVPQGQAWNNNYKNSASSKLATNLAQTPTAPTRGTKEQPPTIPNQNIFGNKPPLLQNPEEEYFDSYGEMEAQEITNEHTRTPEAGLEKYAPVNQRPKAQSEQNNRQQYYKETEQPHVAPKFASWRQNTPQKAPNAKINNEEDEGPLHIDYHELPPRDYIDNDNEGQYMQQEMLIESGQVQLDKLHHFDGERDGNQQQINDSDKPIDEDEEDELDTQDSSKESSREQYDKWLAHQPKAE